jgi:ribosomal protein S18 acetylase RimI-like enzyme
MPAILHLFDIAIEWLVSKGITGQWGTEPWSNNAKRVERGTQLIQTSELWIAEMRASPAGVEEKSKVVVGALAVGKANDYIKPADEPELYVKLLITDRGHRGLKIGDVLVDKAKALGEDAGVGLLRVDCYAGSEGKLVKWYESQGFVKTEAFEIDGWPGQLLSMRLD